MRNYFRGNLVSSFCPFSDDSTLTLTLTKNNKLSPHHYPQSLSLSPSPTTAHDLPWMLAKPTAVSSISFFCRTKADIYHLLSVLSWRICSCKFCELHWLRLNENQFQNIRNAKKRTKEVTPPLKPGWTYLYKGEYFTLFSRYKYNFVN